MKALLIVLTSSLLGSITWAQQASLISITSNGNGCPEGSTRSVISPDGTELSVFFDSFSAEAGENSQTRVDRKICQMKMDLSVEPGWSIALLTAEHRGFVNLEQRARALHSVSYSLGAGNQFRSFEQQHFIGPKTEDFLIQSSMNESLAQWSDCRSKNISIYMNLALVSQVGPRVKNKSNALIALDSVDASNLQSFELAWKKCETGERRKHRGRWAKPNQRNGDLRPRDRKIL